MKRIAVAAILFSVFSGLCHAQIAFNLEAPQDDVRARLAVRGRPELDGLQADYWEFVQTRIFPLRLGDIQQIFAPPIATATNWWGPGLDAQRQASGPMVARHPADLVLPITVPETGWVSGLHLPDASRNLNHTDLHTIGDAGYAEFFFANDGQGLETALIFYRMDENFVPLTTTNDFPKRLAWEKEKFAAVKKLLDDNMPKLIDLGEVEVSGSDLNRFDLGGGSVCNFKTVGLNGATPVFPYRLLIGKSSGDVKEGQEYTQVKTIDHAGQVIGFGMDGKFYRMTPKVVEKLHSAKK
jgi:hypothetical protein